MKSTVGIVLIMMGTMLSVLGFRQQSADRQRADAVSQWPTTQGLVEGSHVKLELDKRSAGRRGLAEVTYENYVAHATIKYSVDGQEYSHEVKKPFQAAKTRANRWVRENSAGTQLSVYYDPANPADCQLSRKVSPVGTVFLGMGVFAGLFGIGLVG